jgi:hypothetical protein
MEPRTSDPYERQRAANGVKTAAIVVILGAIALMADHTFFIAPHSRAPDATAAPVAAAPASTPIALPENLRHPTSADVEPPPPSF